MIFQRQNITWSRIVACTLLAIAMLGVTQRTSAQVLTNAEIVKMVQAKLSDAVIVNTIKTSTCKFDTSPDALIQMKQAGVSDKVLEAMTEAKNAGRRESATSPPSKSDAGIPIPENYGIYTVDGGKLHTLIGGNPSDKAPTQPIELYSFETGSPKSYSAATVTPGVAFIVFDQASGDLVHSLSLYRLPYARNLVVTNPDAPLINALGPQTVGAQVTPLQRPLAARLQAFQIPLLSKPVQNQPQMVQVEPSSPLAAGSYLFFVKRGQQYQFEWIAVGSPQPQPRDCVDITFPAGGFGGMMAMNDYWMMHGPATFPEVTPDHYNACGVGSGAISGASPVSVSPGPGAPTGSAPSTLPPLPQPDCGNYSECLAKGDAAYKSFGWPLAMVDFKAASGIDAAKPDAWAKLGLANLASGRGAELPTAWNNASAHGGTVAFDAWHYAGAHYDKGVFHISRGTISFIGPNGETVFSVPPSQVTDLEAHLRHLGPSSSFGMKVGGHRYYFAFRPIGVECKIPSSCGSPTGYDQEGVVANYVVQAIQKLAAGEF